MLTARSPFQGAKVANISPALADERISIPPPKAVVTDLADDERRKCRIPEGRYYPRGEQSEDRENLRPREGIEDVARLWRITVVRGGQQINVTLGG